jgi:hypothetical protein
VNVGSLVGNCLNFDGFLTVFLEGGQGLMEIRGKRWKYLMNFLKNVKAFDANYWEV